MSSTERILCAPRVVTCDPARATKDDPLGVIEQGAVRFSTRILDVGPRAEVTARAPSGVEILEHEGVITPGLVDAHTHAPYAGSRHAEYALRMQGADYEAIAKAGGGIVSSMQAVRATPLDVLEKELALRTNRMRELGVTTIECKSGYGLDLASEVKQLEAVARVDRRASEGVRLVPTYLALHALPPEARGDRDAYAARVAEEWLPRIAELGLAKFVDAYVDRSAFTVEQARLVLGRARELGLGVRVHAGQFADVGAAELAAELGAASADHLEQVSEGGLSAMAKAGVRAVLLPIASFTLKQKPPPIEAMRRAGVKLVVASDANPGTAPSDSLPLAMAFAVVNYGLTVAETILGATREAAASLGLEDETGMLRVGLSPDMVQWELPHEAAILEPWGGSRTRASFARPFRGSH